MFKSIHKYMNQSEKMSKSYVPPFKRNDKKTTNDLMENKQWVSESSTSYKKKPINNEKNFPSLNSNIPSNPPLETSSKKFKDLFKNVNKKKKKKKNDLPPGWIKLSKNKKYNKEKNENDSEINEENLQKMVNRWSDHCDNHWELNNEDIEYIVTESESEASCDDQSQSDDSISEEDDLDDLPAKHKWF